MSRQQSIWGRWSSSPSARTDRARVTNLSSPSPSQQTSVAEGDGLRQRERAATQLIVSQLTLIWRMVNVIGSSKEEIDYQLTTFMLQALHVLEKCSEATVRQPATRHSALAKHTFCSKYNCFKFLLDFQTGFLFRPILVRLGRSFSAKAQFSIKICLSICVNAQLFKSTNVICDVIKGN